MLIYLSLIFGCQLVGEWVSGALAIPLPVTVLGMIVLFLLLSIRGSVPEKLSSTADGLLAHLSLLFLPAGVGVMLNFSLLGVYWASITLALVVSTVLTIVVTALMMSWLTKYTATPGKNGTED